MSNVMASNGLFEDLCRMMGEDVPESVLSRLCLGRNNDALHGIM